MPRFRPQISLTAALLLITVAGMALVIFLQWRELVSLRSEVRQIRMQLGRLTVDDTTRIHAIEVRQPDRNLWRWRIYLPPGRKYRLIEFGGTLPARGSLTAQQWFDVLMRAPIGRGEYSGAELAGEFTLEANFTPVDGRWKFETHPGGGNSQYVFTDNWPAQSYRLAASDVWKDQQRIYDSGKPILLLWLPKPDTTKMIGGGTGYQTPKEAAEGIVLWLEQQ